MAATLRLFPLLAFAFLHAPGLSHAPAPDRAFDEYQNICWEHETARLDNFAVELQSDPTATGLIVFYDGDPSCYEAAVARVIRARRYLTEYRHVEWNRVMWRYGGRRQDMTFTLLVVPRGARAYQPSPTLGPAGVRVKGCEARQHRRPKCPS